MQGSTAVSTIGSKSTRAKAKARQKERRRKQRAKRKEKQRLREERSAAANFVVEGHFEDVKRLIAQRLLEPGADPIEEAFYALKALRAVLSGPHELQVQLGKGQWRRVTGADFGNVPVRDVAVVFNSHSHIPAPMLLWGGSRYPLQDEVLRIARQAELLDEVLPEAQRLHDLFGGKGHLVVHWNSGQQA